jgi:hypothetical protein
MKYPKLLEAQALDGYRLALLYDNGEKRVFEFAENLAHSYYRELADRAVFASVNVVDGELFWPSGQDFCPHTLYDKSLAV